jgi:hypothetical protein
MAESVVKYLPAINSASSFPVEAIRRNADAVIEPSGKANCAATSRRNGVVGVTDPGVGNRMLRVIPIAVHDFFGGAESAARQQS